MYRDLCLDIVFACPSHCKRGGSQGNHRSMLNLLRSMLRWPAGREAHNHGF